MIYLDHAATSPPREAAVQAVLSALREDWGNPSSLHAPGQAAKRRLMTARAQVAALLGVKPAELVFTSGATEANHHAVRGALARTTPASDGPRRWLLSAVEHPSLQSLAHRLVHEGVQVRWLPVDARGVLDLDAARAAIRPGTTLVSVMAANHETGVLQPVAAVAALCAAAGVPYHCDATQALGKAPLDLAGVTLASVSAHKIGGPKGVGALVMRGAATLSWPALFDGRQERNRRAGTENLPGIAGFGAAAAEVQAGLPDELPRLAALRDRLEAALVRDLGAVVLGAGAPRTAAHCAVRFPGLHAEAALARLEHAGIAAASGAACHAGGTTPSPVLCAMGLDDDAAREGLRFSLGHSTTAADIDAAIAAATAALSSIPA